MTEDELLGVNVLDAAEQTGASGDEAYPQVIERLLTQAQIDEFMRNGVVVIPDVLSPEEVETARSGLHGELARYGVVVQTTGRSETSAVLHVPRYRALTLRRSNVCCRGL